MRSILRLPLVLSLASLAGWSAAVSSPVDQQPGQRVQAAWSLRAARQAPAAAPAAQAPAGDRRLGPLRDLNGIFPFEPSSTRVRPGSARSRRAPAPGAGGARPLAVADAHAAARRGARQGDARGVLRRARVLREPARALRHREPLPSDRPAGQAARRALAARPLAGRAVPGRRAGGAARSSWRRAPRRSTSGARHPLQARAVQLARMGAIVFLYDMEGYADSTQIPQAIAHGGRDDDAGGPGPLLQRCRSRAGCSPSWDCRSGTPIRALDWLTALPDVDPSAHRDDGRQRRRHADIHHGRDRHAPCRCCFRPSWSRPGCRAAAPARTPLPSCRARATSRSRRSARRGRSA